MHKKPCGLLNINHYYDPLISLFDHMIDQKFLQEKFRSMAIIEEQPGALLERFVTYEAPPIKSFE